MQSTHFDGAGNAIMVDISEKKPTKRTAIAGGRIFMNRDALEAITYGTASKGDVLGVARVAGIMALKRTGEFIPLCHPLPISSATIDFDIDEAGCSVRAVCTVSTTYLTGVEMEALTGATTALLTVYDMCKGIDKTMKISDVHLMSKSGGKSGLFVYPGESL